MKFILATLVLALLGIAAAASPQQRQILITYPKDTPMSVVEEAKDVIRDAGGFITHDFGDYSISLSDCLTLTGLDLIKGFIATTTAKVTTKIKALSTQYIPSIEDDSIASANGQ